MRKLHSRFLLSFIQAVQVFVPHPHGKQNMMYMQFGSDGFVGTMNTCSGLKRRRNFEWLGFKSILLNRNNLSGFFISTEGFAVCGLANAFSFVLTLWVFSCSKIQQRCPLTSLPQNPFTLVGGPPYVLSALLTFCNRKVTALGTTATLPSHAPCSPLPL